MQKPSSLQFEGDRIAIRRVNLHEARSIIILCQQLGYDATLIEIQQRLEKIEVDESHVIYKARSLE